MDFTPWPKIARLNRDIIVTEKIDGTNAAVIIEAIEPLGSTFDGERVANGARMKYMGRTYVAWEDTVFLVGAQSRKRLITAGDDNFGFAAWVEQHAVRLVDYLGVGRHFGEWWGPGIQRGYGVPEKRFSLFNTHQWKGLTTSFGLGVVPVLYHGPFSQAAIDGSLNTLAAHGSLAAPGFQRPEGIVVFHTAAGTMFKVTLEGDEKPKGSSE